ncbi:MAG TPA: Stk1 family PASTA domain-containing Ser/Thr kinase [Solirubrobacteraceae bacterium]|nr:Stk1 family PASTA domain-containing Ser/Thr kinase [Solirubrobacteraceae bacterium]
MSEFDAGTIIDGRYRVLHRLGAGGMADVYLAQDEQLDREVALKLLHRRFAEDPGFVERFRREAQAAASLQHPNVVSVFDRGTFEDTYYIAMEYLDGRTLKRLIREEAPLETTRAIDLTIQMLKAARFAHRRGVIHRDLKPHNVIVDSGDHVKVTDFGIARAGASDMTETGSIMGTAQYLSPEQAQGHAVSAPSDLYSVGIVLYEMLTGRVPFDGESPVSIALKHVSEAPIPPSQFNPEIPSALEQVVLWSLNKDPADRPADADQFIMALEQVREALAAPAGEVTASMRALAAGTGLVPVGATPHTSLMPAEAADGNGGAVGLAFDGDQLDRHHDDDQRDQRKRPIWPWIVALVVLLLIGGGVAAYLLTRPQKVLLPAVVNLMLPDAQRQLQGDGFVVITNSQPSKYANGIVIAQNPLGDARVKSGSIVTLTVSTGPATTTVPSVAQLTQAQAEAQIRQAGLKVLQVTTETSTSVPAGEATRTYPVGGASVSRGRGVILYMSSGLAVPDVVGDNVGDAENALTQFNVHVVQQTTTTATPGTVLSQSPTFGKAVGQNGTVTLTVAQAPSTVKVPRVVGDTPSEAVSTLTAAGLNSAQVPTTVRNLNLVGLVVSQFPTSNSMVKRGTVVTITVGQAAPSNSNGTGGTGGTGGAGATSTHTTSSTPTTTSSPSTTT